MSDSPIFDRMVSEFAAAGAVYDDFVKWSTPEFRWSGSNRGVNLTRPALIAIEAAPAEAPEVVEVDAERVWGDYTLSLVMEGLHPTVKPLSERNSAQPME